MEVLQDVQDRLKLEVKVEPHKVYKESGKTRSSSWSLKIPNQKTTKPPGGRHTPDEGYQKKA